MNNTDRRSHRSTCSVWGSATSKCNASGRCDVDILSVPESRVSLDIDTRERLSGNINAVCKTMNEYKANKLNRGEQTKLESLSKRTSKAKEMHDRQLRHTEKAFRAKSARLFNRLQSLDSTYQSRSRPSSLTSRPTSSSRLLPRRPNSLPARVKTVTDKPDNNGRCTTCAQIQRVIQMYEHEGKRTGVLNDVIEHTTCMFSDIQVQTFIDMLQAKYLEDVPNLSNKLRDNGDLPTLDQSTKGHKLSLTEINQSLENKNIELRISRFCKDLDKYNKSNESIPKEVRDAVERVRIKDAILLLHRAPPRYMQIRREMEQMLDL